MSRERISFPADVDAFGNPIWNLASIEDREEREDGTWLLVLPAYSNSESDAQWVMASKVRWIASES